MAKPPSKKSARSPVISNRRAYHEYTILDTYTAGLVLTGTEIKSIRAGKASITEAFARIKDGEIWLYGMQVLPYDHGTHYNHDPLRTRKLLLKKTEIARLHAKVQQSGLTLVPIKLFFSKCWVKLELGLGQGKKLHDKRASEAEKTAKRDIQRAVKQFER